MAALENKISVKIISGFNGDHRFLSNFTPAPVRLDGVLYPSVECGYQAAKTLNPLERRAFVTAVSSAAKRLGKTVTVSTDWEQRKLGVMLELLRQKFANELHRTRLLATRGAALVEDNFWGDRFWGVCRGEGLNHLGRLLETVRDELQNSHRS